MLEKLLENVTEYTIKARELKSNYENKIKEINLTYKNDMATKLEEKAKSEYKSALDDLFKLVENLPSEISETRNRLLELLRKPIPENIFNLIKSYSLIPVNSLTDSDIEILTQNSKDNFVARRLVSKKFGIEDSSILEYDNAISIVDYFDEVVNKHIIDSYKKYEVPNTDIYEVRVLLYPERTNEFVEKLNSFYNQFVK